MLDNKNYESLSNKFVKDVLSQLRSERNAEPEWSDILCQTSKKR